MNEVWTEVMFIDRWIGEAWSTYYIGNPSEVEEALTEELKNEPVVTFEVIDSFVVD